MVALQCITDMQTKYQVLHQDQLQISTAVVRSGTGSAESGSRRQDEPLSWFWTMNMKADVKASDVGM